MTASTCFAAKLPKNRFQSGQLTRHHLAEKADQRYFCYVPQRGGAQLPIFVTVHGISRNAREHAERFAPYAERYGVVLVSPYFSKKRFPDYQRLGRSASEARADLVLRDIIADVSRSTGARGDAIYLFGYSGGAQFAHRYALAYPEQVARLVLGAAGWYTFPDPALKYPRGIRPSRNLPDLAFDPRRFLTVPTCVVVGERDVRRDKALNTSPVIEKQQGVTRLERGAQWIAAMTHAADDYGIRSAYNFVTLPGARHSFSQSMVRGGMGDHVFNYLFGDAS